MKRHDENDEGIGTFMYIAGVLSTLIAGGILQFIIHYIGG